VDNTKKPTVVSVCTGYGGLELGLERVIGAVECLLAVEIEAFACANLVAKMEAGHMAPSPIWTDVKTVPRYCLDALCYGVDWLLGGFPCQPFSQAGQGVADQDPRHLFPAIARLAEMVRPTCILLENVEGIVSSKLRGDGWVDDEGTPVLLHVLRELERRGYAATWDTASADETGAPHERKRVFILAVRSDVLEHMQREGPEGYKWNVPGVYQPGRECTEEGGPTAEADIRFDDWPMPRFRMPCGRVLAPWQWDWEPPRTMGDSKGDGRTRSVDGGTRGATGTSEGVSISNPKGNERSQSEAGDGRRMSTGGSGGNRDGNISQPPLGGSAHGSAPRLAATECDSRVDEVRLARNGVVPAEAEASIRRMMKELFA